MSDDLRFAFMEARQEFERAAARLKVGDDAALAEFHRATSAMSAAARECFESEAAKAERAAFRRRFADMTTGFRQLNEQLVAKLATLRVESGPA